MKFLSILKRLYQSFVGVPGFPDLTAGVYNYIVWLARPSRLRPGRLEGKERSIGVEISSHFFDQSDAFATNLWQRYS